MATTPESKERMAIRRKIQMRVAAQKKREESLMLNHEATQALKAKTICGACKKNKLECKCGHPLLLEEDPVKLNMLREAFKLGCSDSHACIFAEISVDALQNYIKKYPGFAVEKEKLKLLPLMKAKSNVIGAVAAGNLQQSNWYLERKNRQEFGDKTEIEHSGQITHGVVVLPSQVSIDTTATVVQDTEDKTNE